VKPPERAARAAEEAGNYVGAGFYSTETKFLHFSLEVPPYALYLTPSVPG